ncbi:hypothetical protein ACFX2I_019811 [Malus domestica]
MSIISYDNNLGDSKSTGSWRTDDEVMSIYEGWLAEHGKAYNALGEKERQFQIFKDNLRYINEQNSKNLRDREASEARRRVMEVEIAAGLETSLGWVPVKMLGWSGFTGCWPFSSPVDLLLTLSVGPQLIYALYSFVFGILVI